MPGLCDVTSPVVITSDIEGISTSSPATSPASSHPSSEDNVDYQNEMVGLKHVFLQTQWNMSVLVIGA